MNDDDAWRISCHEAGHAIVAVRLLLPFDSVERGLGDQGFVDGSNPIDDDEDQCWPNDCLRKYQCFYAAGAAAEKLLFELWREPALRVDRKHHALIEQRLNQHRTSGFDEDIQAAARLLKACEVESVAKQLAQKRKLTFAEVAELIGCQLPWDLPVNISSPTVTIAAVPAARPPKSRRPPRASAP
jgi:hypothetical protein